VITAPIKEKAKKEKPAQKENDKEVATVEKTASSVSVD